MHTFPFCSCLLTTRRQANKHHLTNKSSNPAGVIASSLPTYLASSHPLNPTGRDIDILDSVQGGWGEIGAAHGLIRDKIRAIHAEHADDVDLFIHLGRSPWDYLSIERRAFRQDMTCTWLRESAEKEGYYLNPDNRGEYVRDMVSPWNDVPIGLQSEVPISETAEVANMSLKRFEGTDTGRRLDVKPHFEAGDLGCGFTYYESMANCYVQGRQRRVLFCHVPPAVDEQSIDSARTALLAVIGAALESLSQLGKDKGSGEFSSIEFGKLNG